MSRFVYFDTKGRIILTSNVLINNGLAYIDTDIPGELFDYYVEAGNLQKMPPSPSEYYIFNYDIKIWEPNSDLSQVLQSIRYTRDKLLKESDWTQLPDVPLATKEAWAAYRQALRDVTDQPDPFNIVWPTPPN